MAAIEEELLSRQWNGGNRRGIAPRQWMAAIEEELLPRQWNGGNRRGIAA